MRAEINESALVEALDEVNYELNGSQLKHIPGAIKWTYINNLEDLRDKLEMVLGNLEEISEI